MKLDILWKAMGQIMACNFIVDLAKFVYEMFTLKFSIEKKVSVHTNKSIFHLLCSIYSYNITIRNNKKYNKNFHLETVLWYTQELFVVCFFFKPKIEIGVQKNYFMGFNHLFCRNKYYASIKVFIIWHNIFNIYFDCRVPTFRLFHQVFESMGQTGMNES